MKLVDTILDSLDGKSYRSKEALELKEKEMELVKHRFTFFHEKLRKLNKRNKEV